MIVDVALTSLWSVFVSQPPWGLEFVMKCLKFFLLLCNLFGFYMGFSWAGHHDCLLLCIERMSMLFCDIVCV